MAHVLLSKTGLGLLLPDLSEGSCVNYAIKARIALGMFGGHARIKTISACDWNRR